jgi:ABC-type phosphate transport system substrate-binding protein
MMSFALKAQSFKVIVNAANDVTTLTQKDAANYYFKKKAKWPSGEKVAPVDLKKGNQAREDFSDQVLGKSVGAVKSYWQQFVFAGKGTPPTEHESDASVVDYVKSNPGALGYVSDGADVSGVKVVNIN